MKKSLTVPPRTGNGFTLIELLIVIGIIAVLIAILLPATSRARDYGRKIKCASQLRQIGFAVQMYTSTYRDTLNASRPGGRWLTTTAVPALTDSQGTKAYWGVAYAHFLLSGDVLRRTGPQSGAILQAAHGVWHCPSSTNTDPSQSTNPDDPITYGINGMITGTIPPKWRRKASYRNSSEIIFAQDALKTQLNNYEADMLSSFNGPSNLTDWRPGGPNYAITTAGVRENYRHLRQCNVLWLDGHVSSIPQSDGTDIPPRWYNPDYVN